mgnify:CR=1 FL=1
MDAEPKKFRVVTDGSLVTTKVYMGDEQLRGIAAIGWNVEGNGLGMLTLTIEEPWFEIVQAPPMDEDTK